MWDQRLEAGVPVLTLVPCVTHFGKLFSHLSCFMSWGPGWEASAGVNSQARGLVPVDREQIQDPFTDEKLLEAMRFLGWGRIWKK